MEKTAGMMSKKSHNLNLRYGDMGIRTVTTTSWEMKPQKLYPLLISLCDKIFFKISNSVHISRYIQWLYIIIGHIDMRQVVNNFRHKFLVDSLCVLEWFHLKGHGAWSNSGIKKIWLIRAQRIIFYKLNICKLLHMTKFLS